MGYVYRYTDLSDNIIKYVGIVWSDSSSLLQRTRQHFLSDRWCYEGQWKIEYLEIDNKTDCEGLESHFISLYDTSKWYNKRKSDWGVSSIYSQIDFKWKELIYNPEDLKRNSMSTKTNALHTEEEINAVINYFIKEISKCHSLKRETTARRNLTMFVCAINLGLRGGDLCKLKWNIFFDDSWHWRFHKDFISDKSGIGKEIELTWNEDLKVTLENWLTWLKLSGKVTVDDYVFTTTHGHIEISTWLEIVNKATKSVGIKQRIGTRGLRKTMINRYYKQQDNKLPNLLN